MKHNPLTCLVCAPIVTSAAYKRGVARARAAVTGQPAVDNPAAALLEATR